MNREDFEEFGRLFNNDSDKILNEKGHDYSAENDRLGNFKRLAAALSLDPCEIWAVYTAKHCEAILTWVREKKLESESLRSRFIDLRNYAILGAALAKDLSS